jgi:hypothetical protein
LNVIKQFLTHTRLDAIDPALLICEWFLLPKLVVGNVDGSDHYDEGMVLLLLFLFCFSDDSIVMFFCVCALQQH